ncbi:MAG: hypothetical protein OEZ58_17470 [Gammaproteobacteria bacterium]|nr:hypothetical protein [Gammaproteobacteria bacterium]MDH5730781.1 hypothetical protein [Gammaproteobacteria bacterium]
MDCKKLRLRKDKFFNEVQYEIETTYFNNIRHSGNAISRVPQNNNSANEGKRFVLIQISFLEPIVDTNNLQSNQEISQTQIAPPDL